MQLPGVRPSVCLSVPCCGGRMRATLSVEVEYRLVVFPRVAKKLGKGSVVGAVYGWTTWPTGR